MVEGGSPGSAQKHSRHGDHRKAGIAFAQCLDQGHAIDARHEEIGDHHIKFGLFEPCQAQLAALCPNHVKTFGLQSQQDRGTHMVLVVDNENAWHGAALWVGWSKCPNKDIRAVSASTHYHRAIVNVTFLTSGFHPVMMPSSALVTI